MSVNQENENSAYELPKPIPLEELRQKISNESEWALRAVAVFFREDMLTDEFLEKMVSSISSSLSIFNEQTLVCSVCNEIVDTINQIFNEHSTHNNMDISTEQWVKYLSLDPDAKAIVDYILNNSEQLLLNIQNTIQERKIREKQSKYYDISNYEERMQALLSWAHANKENSDKDYSAQDSIRNIFEALSIFSKAAREQKDVQYE